MTRPARRRLADAALTAAARTAVSRHWGLLLLLEAGIVLRAYVVRAYTPAFSFPDSADYLAAAAAGEPLRHRPFGYSAFLALLDGVVPFDAVAAVQHGLGLVAAVVVYAVLLRRGVRRRWAVLAAAPLALDAYLLAVEHYLLAESLFVLQLAGAVALLLWRERPGWALAGAAGLVLGAAAVTRTVGLVVVATAGAYLLARLVTRSLRWTAVASFAAGSAAVVLSYSAWFAGHYGTFSTTAYTGYFLYGRVSTFVDCAVTDVPPRLRGLCPTQPVDRRPPPDFYTWDAASPAQSGRWSDRDLRSFAVAAMTQQPGDYARTTARSLARYVQPGRTAGRADVCPSYWRFPQVLDLSASCTADLADRGFDGEPVDIALRPRPAAVLGAYQSVGYTPGPLLGLLLLAALAGAARRGRTAPERLDPLLLAGVGVALVAVPSATAVMDVRYGLPLLVVLPAAAALALRGAAWPQRPAPAAQVPDDASCLLTAVPSSGGTDRDRR